MPGPPPSKAPKGNFGEVAKSLNLSPGLPPAPVSLSPPLSPALPVSPVSPKHSAKPEEDVPTAEAKLSGIVKKKSQKNRHLWNARYVELRGRDLVFFRSKADAAINRSPVIALFEDMIQVEIPKVGRGVDDGTRFNIRLHSLNSVVSANPFKTMRAGLLELQAPDLKACHMWTKALQSLGVKIIEGVMPSDVLPEATETVSPEAKAQLLRRFGGHLKKKSRKMKAIWVSRYVVLQERRLSYYRAEEDARDEINPTHLLWSEIVSVTANPTDPTRFTMAIRDREAIEWQAGKDDYRGWLLLFEQKLGGGDGKSEPALPPRPKARAKSPAPSSSPSPTSTAAASKPSPTPTESLPTTVAPPTPAPTTTPFVPSKPPPSVVVTKPSAVESKPFTPLPSKPSSTPSIAPPSTTTTAPVQKPPTETKSAVPQTDRLRELMSVGSPVKKKGVQYPHNWHPRHMIVVDEQLCYYANADDCVKNINAKVVPLFDILSVKIPTRGRGAADGLRFNMEMVGGALLEWQAMTKETTQDWAALFEKFGITETSGVARQKARKEEKKAPEKVAEKAEKTERPEKKEEKQAESPKAEKPVYQPSKSRTGLYTIKPVIGLRVVMHENKGVLVAAVTAEPAQQAGLRKGDVVKTINGSPIKREEDCSAILKSAKIGDQLVFLVQRGGKDTSCTVTVGIKEPEVKSKLIPKALRGVLEPAAAQPKAKAPGDDKQCALCDRTGHTSKDHECGGCRAIGLHRGRYCPSCPPAVGLSWDESPEGCTVTVLDAGSAAEISGLRAGDLLEKIETIPIKTGLDIRKSMEGVKPGQTLEFRIAREGKHEIINVRVLAKRNKKFAVKNLVDGVKQVKNQIAR